MIFRNEEDVRPQRDERIPLVDLEFGGKAGNCPAVGGRVGSADLAGRLPARSACLPRKLSQSLGAGLDWRWSRPAWRNIVSRRKSRAPFDQVVVQATFVLAVGLLAGAVLLYARECET